MINTLEWSLRPRPLVSPVRNNIRILSLHLSPVARDEHTLNAALTISPSGRVLFLALQVLLSSLQSKLPGGGSLGLLFMIGARSSRSTSVAAIDYDHGSSQSGDLHFVLRLLGHQKNGSMVAVLVLLV